MLFGHGGDVYSLSRDLDIKPAQVLDFSSNCSPLPYPEGFSQYLSRNIHQLHLLPEVDSFSVRKRLSDRYGLPADSFLLGSGTTQWIFSLPRILKARRAFIPLPTYSDYEDACKAAGLDVEHLGPYSDGSEESVKQFSQDLLSLKEKDLENALFFVCNPNNPTGLFIPPRQLMELIRRYSRATWVIDEAYAPFVSADCHSSLITEKLPSNVLILRSFSKIYGIPGLRIGCLVTTGNIMNKLRSNERPWAVNRMAQLAARFLLRMPEYEKEVRRCCHDEKQRIISGLSSIESLEYLYGRTHFAIFRVKRPLTARALFEGLRQKGMLIRDCGNFSGLSGDHIRISPRMADDNLELIIAIRQLAAKAGIF